VDGRRVACSSEDYRRRGRAQEWIEHMGGGERSKADKEKAG